MKSFYFTYGSGHTDKDGNSLGNNYTEIKAAGYDEAREMMEKARGAKWSFMYEESEKCLCIDRWILSPRSLESVTLINNYFVAKQAKDYQPGDELVIDLVGTKLRFRVASVTDTGHNFVRINFSCGRSLWCPHDETTFSFPEVDYDGVILS